VKLQSCRENPDPMASNKRETEKEIFAALLKAAPRFVGEPIENWAQPADEKDFPDVVCRTPSGKRIGVELGEWLNEEQSGTLL